jgi:hypothetical protein
VDIEEMGLAEVWYRPTLGVWPQLQMTGIEPA